ncbi:hypothetical protein GCM10023205_08880 [Yinghuangia aomiensis]|uniref:Protein phosphatase 2C n=1 Tax=Yinghuangia aomiensis TaxID=676205 RepID=A0ABP9GUC5_9ACTN
MLVEVLTDPGSSAPAALVGEPRAAERVFALAGPEAAVLAAAGAAYRADGTGCGHGSGWFLRRLAAHLLTRIVDRPERPLRDCLADAVAETAALHGGRCDLARHGAPTASVTAVRVADGRLDHLVLGTGAVLVRRGAAAHAAADPAGERHAAGARPAAAAADAVCGSAPLPGVHTIALLDGGAGPPPDPPTAVRIMEQAGAHGLLAHMRADEARRNMPHAPFGAVLLRPR